MILRTGPAARLCGIARSTLHAWTQTDKRVRACQFKRGWYVIDKLAALGLCAQPDTAARTIPIPQTDPRPAGSAPFEFKRTDGERS